MPAESIDLIIAAQAFHWFNQPLFKKECQRILTPHGQVALVWNSRVADSPLVRKSSAINQMWCPEFTGFSGEKTESPEIFQAFFKHGHYSVRSYDSPLVYDRNHFIGRQLSASYAPKKGDSSYEPFIQAFSALFDQYENEGTITVPNVTSVYLGSV
ncbi:methyltransferase domain-containing protein [Bacillus testis]|uniref:methyltransferase domain-containing protein n=1 Tax=Bacillus testis TaxID=1622072 RepID=UPI00164E78D6|nr:methyltransferase domain-containing protein [Bacillus testis]